jgi:hypothetical protein
MAPVIRTVRDQIAWSYANLARAHAALEAGSSKYAPLHHIIRARLFKGMTSGAMSMRSLYDDEKIKLTSERACSYCGSRKNLSVDHLFPRIKDGADYVDNLIAACRSCNSSKSGLDMMEWMIKRKQFPSVFVLRRYLKLVARYCERQGIMDIDLVSARGMMLPFNLEILPLEFPHLSTMSLSVTLREM